MTTYYCPVCFINIDSELISNSDNILCNNCNTELVLDYIGDLPDTQYFLRTKVKEDFL